MVALSTSGQFACSAIPQIQAGYRGNQSLPFHTVPLVKCTVLQEYSRALENAESEVTTF